MQRRRGGFRFVKLPLVILMWTTRRGWGWLGTQTLPVITTHVGICPTARTTAGVSNRIVRQKSRIRAVSSVLVARAGIADGFPSRNAPMNRKQRRNMQRFSSLDNHHSHAKDTSTSKLETAIHDVLCEFTETSSCDPFQATILLLGVSGGCDSIGLFHGLLNTLNRTTANESTDPNMRTLQCSERLFFYSLHVVHFDHQLRDSESDGDRTFVEELCAKSGIPFHCYTWKNQRDHQAPGTFSQEAARQWRRSRMGNLLRELTIDKQPGMILTAHHADDSMESLLLKLLRGTHISNIKGMDVHTQDEFNNPIVRPLLSLKKKEIVEYLQQRFLPWREDSSNGSNKYRRNQVRNELVPLLSDLVGGEDILHRRLDTLSRQSTELRNDLEARAHEYLADMDATSFVLPDTGLELEHKEALHLWLTEQTGGLSFNFDALERVFDKIKRNPDTLLWKLNVGHGWNILREGDILTLEKFDQPDGAGDENDGEEKSIYKELSWRTESSGCDAKGAVHEITFRMPASTNCCGVFLSTVRSDNLMFTPPWRIGRQPTKVSQFLRGQKIPLHVRRDCKIIFASDSAGGKTAVAVELPSKEWLLDCSLSDRNQDAETVIVTLPN